MVMGVEVIVGGKKEDLLEGERGLEKIRVAFKVGSQDGEIAGNASGVTSMALVGSRLSALATSDGLQLAVQFNTRTAGTKEELHR